MSCSNAPHSISFNHEKKTHTQSDKKFTPPFSHYFFATVPSRYSPLFSSEKPETKKPTATPLIDSDFPKRAEQRPYLNKLLLLHSFLHIHTKTLNRENFSCLETVSYFPLL